VPQDLTEVCLLNLGADVLLGIVVRVLDKRLDEEVLHLRINRLLGEVARHVVGCVVRADLFLASFFTADVVDRLLEHAPEDRRIEVLSAHLQPMPLDEVLDDGGKCPVHEVVLRLVRDVLTEEPAVQVRYICVPAGSEFWTALAFVCIEQIVEQRLDIRLVERSGMDSALSS